MTCSVVALVGRPNPMSASMCGLIVKSPDGSLRVRGVVGAGARPIEPDEYRSLVDGNHVRCVRPTDVSDGLADDAVVLWVGNGFVDAAAQHGLAAPAGTGPCDVGIELCGGKAWVGSPALVFAELEAWLRGALRAVIERGSRNLAELMVWVIPDHPMTRAALWLTAADDAARALELSWFARIDGDRRGAAADAVEELRLLGARVASDPYAARHAAAEAAEAPPWVAAAASGPETRSLSMAARALEMMAGLREARYASPEVAAAVRRVCEATADLVRLVGDRADADGATADRAAEEGRGGS